MFNGFLCKKEAGETEEIAWEYPEPANTALNSVWIEKRALRKRPHVSPGRHQQPACGDEHQWVPGSWAWRGETEAAGENREERRSIRRRKLVSKGFVWVNPLPVSFFTSCSFPVDKEHSSPLPSSAVVLFLITACSLPSKPWSGKISSGKRRATSISTLCEGHLSKGLPALWIRGILRKQVILQLMWSGTNEERWFPGQSGNKFHCSQIFRIIES